MPDGDQRKPKYSCGSISTNPMTVCLGVRTDLILRMLGRQERRPA